MNIRKNLTLIVSGGVALVCLLAALFIVFRYHGRYSDVRAQLDEVKMRRDSLIHRMPFPNEENVLLTETNVVQNREALRQLQSRLVRGQYSPPALGPDRFPGELSKVVQTLNREAKEDGVTVAAPAATYGFEKYAKGELPQREHIATLLRQLDWVRVTCQALFDAKITQLESVERRAFESAAPAAGGESPLGGMPGIERRPSDLTGEGGHAGLLQAHVTDPDNLFERERMIFSFIATETSLRDALNNLARLPEFCAVMSLTTDNLTPKPQRAALKKPGEDGAPAGGPASALSPLSGGVGGYALPPLGADRPRGMPPGTGLSGGEPGVEGRTGPRTRQQRVIAGGSEFLKVTLEIDYYHFAPPDKEAQP